MVTERILCHDTCAALLFLTHLLEGRKNQLVRSFHDTMLLTVYSAQMAEPASDVCDDRNGHALMESSSWPVPDSTCSPISSSTSSLPPSSRSFIWSIRPTKARTRVWSSIRRPCSLIEL